MIKTYFESADRGSPHRVPPRGLSRRGPCCLQNTPHAAAVTDSGLFCTFTRQQRGHSGRAWQLRQAFVFITTVYNAPEGGQPQQGSLHVCTQTVHQTRTWKIKPKGLDFNERKNISNIILGVSNGLIKKYFWYRKACPQVNVSEGPHLLEVGGKGEHMVAGPALPAHSDCPPSPHTQQCPCCEGTGTTREL